MKTIKTIKKTTFLLILSIIVFSCCNDDIQECDTCDCNIAYDIEGWNQTDFFIHSFNDDVINAEFSRLGDYLFLTSGSDSTLKRYGINTLWDIQSINTTPQQSAFLETPTYSVWDATGLHLFQKETSNNYWFKKVQNDEYDVNGFGQTDPVEFHKDNFIYYLDDGTKFYGKDDSVFYEYEAQVPLALDEPETFSSIDMNSIIPIDGFNFVSFKYSPDGLKAFFVKELIGSSSSVVRIYQIDLASNFDLSTQTYNGVFVELNITGSIKGFQFSSDGKSFFIIEGDDVQVIRKIC